MEDQSTQKPPGKRKRPGKVETGPGKYRVLHMLVPPEAYWHARRMAIESKLSFRDFATVLLLDSVPYPQEISEKLLSSVRPPSHTSDNYLEATTASQTGLAEGDTTDDPQPAP